MKSHARFLFLFDEKPHVRWTTFDRTTKRCTDATSATYWGGVLSLIKETRGSPRRREEGDGVVGKTGEPTRPSRLTEIQAAQLFFN
jgi:hypothetical protein